MRAPMRAHACTRAQTCLVVRGRTRLAARYTARLISHCNNLRSNARCCKRGLRWAQQRFGWLGCAALRAGARQWRHVNEQVGGCRRPGTSALWQVTGAKLKYSELARALGHGLRQRCASCIARVSVIGWECGGGRAYGRQALCSPLPSLRRRRAWRIFAGSALSSQRRIFKPAARFRPNIIRIALIALAVRSACARPRTGPLRPSRRGPRTAIYAPVNPRSERYLCGCDFPPRNVPQSHPRCDAARRGLRQP